MNFFKSISLVCAGLVAGAGFGLACSSDPAVSVEDSGVSPDAVDGNVDSTAPSMDSGALADASSEAALTDAAPAARDARACVGCVANYACTANGDGIGILPGKALPNGECMLGGITLSCGGVGVGANGKALRWSEREAGTVFVSTGSLTIQCTAL
jgi:hypothetical protein